MATSAFWGSTSALGSLKSSVPATSSTSQGSSLVVKASSSSSSRSRRKDAIGFAAAVIVAGGLVSGSAGVEQAKAGLVEDLLAKTAANKELNDKKRLTTSGANLSRAYTVQFNTCKFPDNFTGCQDLARKKDVKFISDDLKLECEGKDKYKCGSNVFWKWGQLLAVGVLGRCRHNEGSMPLSHALLLYTVPPNAGFSGAPRRQLAAFKRVFIEQDSSVKVEFHMNPCKDFSYAAADGSRILPGGRHKLVVGAEEHTVRVQAAVAVASA